MKYLKTPNELVTATDLKRIQSRKELKSIYSQSLKLVAEIDGVLKKHWNRRLWRLKTGEDELRILTLNIWSQRYKVSIEYILVQLIPIWTKVFKKLGRQQVSLGCNVSVLTGYKSERILQDCIRRDYPNKENIEIWKQNLRKNTSSELTPHQRKVKIKRLNPLSYRNPKEFMNSYRQDISQKRLQKIKHQEKTIRRNFRDSNLWT